jgi:hypothetical protein
MGGSMIGTGEFAVEVVASASGTIDASINTAAGQAVPHLDVSALEVTVQGEGQARQKVALVWDAPRAVFHGRAAADARLASGPFEVSFAIAGRTHTGRLELGMVLPRPKFGGHMIAVGKYSAEVVPKVDGEIEVHLSDATGAAVQAAAGLDLKLRATGKAGGLQDVALRWDAARARFVGKLEAGAELAAGPIELIVGSGDMAARSRVELAALVEPPSIDADVDAKADAKAGVAARADLKAKAKAEAELAARLKAEAAAAKKAQAKAKADLGALEAKARGSAKLGITAPQPSASLKAGASTKTSADAKAGGSAKGSAKQQTGVKLGGGISLGAN